MGHFSCDIAVSLAVTQYQKCAEKTIRIELLINELFEIQGEDIRLIMFVIQV